MDGVLAGAFSRSDAFKRKLIDALRNPRAKLERVVGDANDRARALNEMTAAAGAEKELYGPASQELAMKMAEGYSPVGMTKVVGPQSAALETARKNAVKMLGLPEGNTAMDRAKALGFDTPAYHGTVAGNIDKFAPNTRGVHFTSPDASFANRYTIDAAGNTVESSNVIPLMVRPNNPFDYQNKIDVKALSRKASLGSLAESQIKKGDWRRLEDRTTIDAIKNIGKGGVYVNEDGVKNLAVFNPNQLRSRFAAFDPARVNENDLLAGMLPLGAIVLPKEDENKNQQRQKQQDIIEALRRKKD